MAAAEKCRAAAAVRRTVAAAADIPAAVGGTAVAAEDIRKGPEELAAAAGWRLGTLRRRAGKSYPESGRILFGLAVADGAGKTPVGNPGPLAGQTGRISSCE